MLNHSFKFFKKNNLDPQKFNSPAHLSQGLCVSFHPKCISLFYLSVTLNPTLACLSKDHTLLPYCKIMRLLKKNPCVVISLDSKHFCLHACVSSPAFPQPPSPPSFSRGRCPFASHLLLILFLLVLWESYSMYSLFPFPIFHHL